MRKDEQPLLYAAAMVCEMGMGHFGHKISWKHGVRIKTFEDSSAEGVSASSAITSVWREL